VNKHLAKLHSGYQDLMDRYGVDDPMVLNLKAEIDRREAAAHDVDLPERRNPLSPAGCWNRVSRRADGLVTPGLPVDLQSMRFGPRSRRWSITSPG
jgi:hypothetical protein